MKKNIVISILSIIALIVISSCSDNGTNPSSNNEIWPLKVGNYWKYEVTGWDTLRNIQYKYDKVCEIINDTIINNETIYKSSLNSFANFNSNEFVKRSDGVYYYDGKDINMLMKYPVTKGEKFTSNLGVMTVESTDYNYITLNSKLSCYKYTMNYALFDMNIYLFKPGVGLISHEFYGYTKSGRLYLAQMLVLKEYKVN